MYIQTSYSWHICSLFLSVFKIASETCGLPDCTSYNPALIGLNCVIRKGLALGWWAEDVCHTLWRAKEEITIKRESGKLKNSAPRCVSRLSRSKLPPIFYLPRRWIFCQTRWVTHENAWNIFFFFFLHKEPFPRYFPATANEKERRRKEKRKKKKKSTQSASPSLFLQARRKSFQKPLIRLIPSSHNKGAHEAKSGSYISPTWRRTSEPSRTDSFLEI